ncbi:MAG: glycosyl hydrolase, partial [Saprospiraceae bacterium]|nr:glycosyl hydrolase [Saprospiraceae bacterium]
MRPLTILLLLTAICQLTAQDIQPPFTPAHERIDGYQNRLAAKERSLVGQIAFRSIGPTVCSGRVADLDVQASDPTHFYVAYASGGLWKTENNGSSFTPLFDREMVMTIGDIAVDWPRNRIWVGTGEVNSSRSSYAGVGIYLSEDDGQTWEHRGLSESHHIGRIVLHPDDPNTLWVAVLGHLYSPNPERGVYKT